MFPLPHIQTISPCLQSAQTLGSLTLWGKGVTINRADISLYRVYNLFHFCFTLHCITLSCSHEWVVQFFWSTHILWCTSILTWGTVTGVAVDAVYTGTAIMTGNRATLIDIGEAVLVCEARMTVTDVIPQEIGAVITVFLVTWGRTPRTLINILCTILTLPLCKS